ncbi:murein biosynthesis integral membrane protein MurJ [Porticoccus sp. W117]|uniref:murein biosynthesis integral membrane protein MurJ n=1 Tax=Porticoccus sp. W117 TaxID=3054777 RepID=UPI0025937219|nr:murein biosynthesis integral membrane protein MurJ [Porticoccus sp. W117]MDM3871268.1 murein biosynthesis integral membrane protein MurJ [Porticoccus sp. W117]
MNSVEQQEKPTKRRGLLGSSLITGSMTMMSRVLGLVRDIVFAQTIGAGGSADSFFLAFKIPNFLRRLFAEGAFAQAFVPVLNEYHEKGGIAAVKELVNRVAASLGSVVLVLTLLVVVFAPQLGSLLAYGFEYRGDGEKAELVGELLRITFPYLFFISMAGMLGGILNSFDRFAVPAFAPVLLNICMIAAAFIGVSYFEEPVMALAWGVFVAGALQMLFQMPFLAKLHLLPTPKWDWNHPGVKKILLLMAPAIFGVSISQINLLLDQVLAAFMQDGAVGWLYYSDRLYELPLGVFGVAIATVILPSLSRQHTAGSGAQFDATLGWAMRSVLYIAVPAMVALFMLAEPLITTLFKSDKFDVADIDMAVLSLRAYALGLVAFMLTKVLATGYFSRQDMKTPVRIGIIAMVTNMVFNLALAIPLEYYYQIGHVGLALATTLSAILNAGLLYRGLRKEGVYQPQPGRARFVFTLILATAAMAATLYGFNQWFTQWQEWLWWQRGYRILIVCGAGFAVYAGALFAAGVRLRDLKAREV